MRPMANAMKCMYFQRLDNHLGDDLLTDFLAPVYFSGRKENISKTASGMGGLYLSNTQTYCVTYDLRLPLSKTKKDDVIVFCGSNDIQHSILNGDRQWRVSSVDCEFDKMQVQFKNDEQNEISAPKRILIQ